MENKKHVHYAWLDAIRFIAAFLVLLCHSRNDFFMKYNFLDADQQGPISFLFYLIGRMGSEAVFAFFILSGFLVGGPGLERIFNSTFDLKNYTVDRSVRIMLPLVSAIVMYLVIAPLLGKILTGGMLLEIFSLYNVYYAILLLLLSGVLAMRSGSMYF